MVSRGLEVVAASHRAAAAAGVFGTPTLRCGDEPGMFVKLGDLLVDPAAAVDLWRHLTALALGHPALLELKRAVPEG